ncbi:hypothetical protein Tco_1328881 [Tanacetum coccineum]
MTTLQFADTYKLVVFLSKPAESEGFEQIVDSLNANPIKYALTINPTIYTSCIEQFWATVKVKTVNGEVQLQALPSKSAWGVWDCQLGNYNMAEGFSGVGGNGLPMVLRGLQGNRDERKPVVVETKVASKDVNLSVDEVTLAQALATLKSAKSKADNVQDKGKGKITEPEKPIKKKELIKLDEEIASKLQAEFNEEVRLERKKAKKEEEANIISWHNVQAMIDADYQIAQ